MASSQCPPEVQTVPRRPVCAHCGNRMWLNRIEADGNDHERLMFVCYVCNQAEIAIVRFRSSPR